VNGYVQRARQRELAQEQLRPALSATGLPYRAMLT